MLYNRDFTKLTEKEQEKIEEAKQYKSEAKNKKSIISGSDISQYYSLLPEAYFFHQSLFPNNYLNRTAPPHLKNVDIQNIFKEFERLIYYDNSTEQEILNFINHNKAYFILESLFNFYHFGHHESYLFKEFQLATNHQADYLLVGKSSGGYEFVFVEFEHPNNNITLKDGDFGDSIRKGIKQVEEWDEWMDSSYSSLKDVFAKYLSNGKYDLPSEFYELDKTRMNYLIVVGKRKHFTKKTYKKARKKEKEKIKLIHYDNLVDETEKLVNHMLG